MKLTFKLQQNILLSAVAVLFAVVSFFFLYIHNANAGVCGDLLALKNGIAQKETGTITIPATDKSKWELRITTVRSRKTCNEDFVKVTVQTVGANNIVSSEEVIIPAKNISNGNDINTTIPLNVSNGTRTYVMDSSKDENFAQHTLNFLKVTSNRLDATPPTNTNTNSPVRVVTPGNITDPFAGKTLSGVVTQVINILLALIVIAAVVVIIIAGFRMITGGANPDQITKAKKTIIWAIIGLVVALMSFAIVGIIGRLL